MQDERKDPGKTARVAVLFFVLALLVGGAVLVYNGVSNWRKTGRVTNPAGNLSQDISARLQWGSQQREERPAPAPGTGGEAAFASDRLSILTGSGRHQIALEIADTEEKKRLGLMFRTSLADGHGMLFLYDEDQEITMWMKNTYIPLDMVFIGADGRVVSVARNTEPMSEAIISSRVPARAVLELKAGAADAYRIEPGKSHIEHPYFARR